MNAIRHEDLYAQGRKLYEQYANDRLSWTGPGEDEYSIGKAMGVLLLARLVGVDLEVPEIPKTPPTGA